MNFEAGPRPGLFKEVGRRPGVSPALKAKKYREAKRPKGFRFGRKRPILDPRRAVEESRDYESDPEPLHPADFE